MAAEVSILIPRRTPRLIFTIRFVFEDLLGLSWETHKKVDAFLESEAPIKINYTKSEVDGVFHIQPHNLLLETEIFEQTIHMSEWEGLPYFFGIKAKSDLPFDPFASTFYCISRYEEYLPFMPDEHGRFPVNQSAAVKHGFLKRPLVNEWWQAIWPLLQKDHAKQLDVKTDWRFISTVDVDNSFAFSGKGPLRVLSAVLKDIYQLDFYTLKRRWTCLVGKEADPFDRYDREMQLAEEKDFDLIYFVLFSELGPHDRNVSRFSQRLQTSIRHIADFAQLGSHPSYRTMDENDRLRDEHRGMQDIVRRKIKMSRQHYLRFRLPQTYRALITLGIEHDYSMGYARETGWRASTCSAFRFYDLELEEETELYVHPFPFMDSVYQDYLKLKPEAAWEEIKTFADQTKFNGGEFISVMHNRNLGDLLPESKDWPELYHRLVDYLT
jgi:hypothetical protein